MSALVSHPLLLSLELLVDLGDLLQVNLVCSTDKKMESYKAWSIFSVMFLSRYRNPFAGVGWRGPLVEMSDFILLLT